MRRPGSGPTALPSSGPWSRAPPAPPATGSRSSSRTGPIAWAHAIVEVPITFNDRVRGVSKMSWHIIGEAMSLVTWWGVRDRLLRRGRRPDGPLVDEQPSEADPAGAVVDSDGSGTAGTASETPAGAAADA